MQYLILLVGFICLIKGADIFVEGASSLAKKFHIPSMIIGLTVVAMGTSAPEAAVSMLSAMNKMTDLSIANVAGSNIFNVLMVLGVSTLICKLPVGKTSIKRDLPLLLVSYILVLIFSVDRVISCFEGTMLLVIFFGFIYSMIRESKNNNESVNEINEIPMIKTLLFTILGLSGIIFGGNLTVDAASTIASQLGMSQNLIGLTVVAIGTSLPELVTSVTAARKGEVDIAIGNVLGSNIFNILMIVGFSSVICPISLDTNSIIDIIFMLLITITFTIEVIRKKEFNKQIGMSYILIYIGYIIYTIIR